MALGFVYVASLLSPAIQKEQFNLLMHFSLLKKNMTLMLH